MTKEKYIQITGPFRDDPHKARLLHRITKGLTYAVMGAYGLLLGYDVWNQNPILARHLIVPMNAYVIVSVFRYVVNRKRPYERFDLPPVIVKNTKGKSFPSRHVFSAYMIAMTFLLATPWTLAGCALLLAAVFLSVLRVVSGVHYPSDVAAGALAGIVAGLVGYLL